MTTTTTPSFFLHKNLSRVCWWYGIGVLLLELLCRPNVIRTDAFSPIRATLVPPHRFSTNLRDGGSISIDDDQVLPASTTTSPPPTSGLTPQQENDLDDLLTEALNRIFFVMESEALSRCNDVALRDLFRRCVNSVVVADSTIPGAGRGLFASEDIPSGTIVAFYAVHAIGCKFPSGVCQSVQMSEDPNEMIDNENSSYALFSLVDRPLCGVDISTQYNDAKLFVDMNPKNTIFEGWYCGYMNDATIVRFAGDEGYYPRSRGAQNVEIVPFSAAPFQVGVTIRDVKKGEELFVSYGYNYWINNQALFPPGSSDTPSTKSSTILDYERKIAADLEKTINLVEDKYREASVALRIAFDSLGSAGEKDDSENDEESRDGRRKRISFRRLVGRLVQWSRRRLTR